MFWKRKPPTAQGEKASPEPSASRETLTPLQPFPTACGIPGLRVRIAHAPSGDPLLWVFDASVATGRVRGHATPAFGAGAPEHLTERLSEEVPPFGLIVAAGSAATGEGALSRGFVDAVSAMGGSVGLPDALVACVGPTAGVPAAGPVTEVFRSLTALPSGPDVGFQKPDVHAKHPSEPFHVAFPFMDAGGDVRVAGWFWPDPAVMVWVSDVPLGRGAGEELIDDLWTAGPDAWALTGDAHPGDAVLILSAVPGPEAAPADERVETLRTALRVGTEMLLRAACAPQGPVPTLTIEGAADLTEAAAAARVWTRTLTRLHAAANLSSSEKAEILFRAMAATPLVGIERSRMGLEPFIREGRLTEEAMALQAIPRECVLTLGRGAARGFWPLREAARSKDAVNDRKKAEQER